MRNRAKPKHLRGGSRRRIAFSLVELVVVILIIGVLAVAVFSGGNAAIKKSRVARTTSDLHNFQVAAETTLNEYPRVANVTTNSMTAGSPLAEIVVAFDDNLAADYKLEDYEPLETVETGNLKITADVADTGRYAVFASKKLDAWDNPYYVVFDSSERHGSASDFSITVASAGPNSISDIGGEIEKDDLLMIAESSNNEVTTQIIDMANVSTVQTEEKTLVVGTSNVREGTVVLTYTGNTGITADAKKVGTDDASANTTDETEAVETNPIPQSNYVASLGNCYYVIYAPDPTIPVQTVAKYGNRLLLVNKNEFEQRTGITVTGSEFEWYYDSGNGERQLIATGPMASNPNGDPFAP